MTTAFKGFTIHEGYNDIGNFTTNITTIEIPELLNPGNDVETAPLELDLLFKLKLVSGVRVPQEYEVNFKVKTVATEFREYTLHPDGNGFVKLTGPLFPIVAIDVPVEEQPKIIRMKVSGPLDERAEECYMRVVLGATTYYTLVKDLCVNDNKLCIYNGTDYFEVQPAVTVATSCKAIYINKDGVLYQYVGASNSWESLTHLGFFKIEFPENLVSATDGFYTADSSVGTISSGHLGSSPFANYSA